MTEQVNTGEYRACPFCFEVIRKNAIKCRHCSSEVDPAKLNQQASKARTNPMHLVVLGFLLLVTAFVAAYPALEKRLDERALAKAMMEKGAAVPAAPRVAMIETPAVEEAPEPAVSFAPPGRLEFGEGVEIVAGQTYSGSTIEDLLEANALGSGTMLESRITVQLAGQSYDIVARQPYFIPEARYEILAIKESSKR